VISDAVKLAKLAKQSQDRDAVLAVFNNPVFSMVAAFVVIEALQQIKLSSGDHFMSRTGTLLEGAIVTKEAWSALASSGILDKIGPALAPLLLKGAAL